MFGLREKLLQESSLCSYFIRNSNSLTHCLDAPTVTVCFPKPIRGSGVLLLDEVLEYFCWWQTSCLLSCSFMIQEMLNSGSWIGTHFQNYAL